MFALALFYVAAITKAFDVSNVFKFLSQNVFTSKSDKKELINIELPQASDNKTAIRLMDKLNLKFQRLSGDLYLTQAYVPIKNYGKLEARGAKVLIQSRTGQVIELNGSNTVPKNSVKIYELESKVKIENSKVFTAEISCANCLDVKF